MMSDLYGGFTDQHDRLACVRLLIANDYACEGLSAIHVCIEKIRRFTLQNCTHIGSPMPFQGHASARGGRLDQKNHSFCRIQVLSFQRTFPARMVASYVSGVQR